MLKMEQESNASWERKRKEKIQDQEKRFIPDKQWTVIVGVVGAILLLFLISGTLNLIMIMLGAEEEEADAGFEEPPPMEFTTTAGTAA